jgi:sugar phosphate isomerase/epimerase
MQRSRRDILKIAAAGIPASVLGWPALAKPQKPNKSYIAGVQLGVQTYSFHEIPNDGKGHVDSIIKDMLACGLYECELFGGPVEPSIMTGQFPPASECPHPELGCSAGKGGSARNPWAWEFVYYKGDELKAAREKQRMWRENESIAYFGDVRKKFDDAQIRVFAYNPLVMADWSDLELDRTFEAAAVLGAKSVNVSTTFTNLKRMVPFAERHKVIVAAHGHSETWNPEAFSTEATFERAFALSPWVGANLDIGHYTAAGGDPVAFLRKHHDRITNLHLKDRKRNTPGAKVEDGATVPWGEGDTPIKNVLLLLQHEHYPIPGFIEYEHAGTQPPVDEVKKCVKLAKQYLGAA